MNFSFVQRHVILLLQSKIDFVFQIKAIINNIYAHKLTIASKFIFINNVQLKKNNLIMGLF